MLSRSPPSARHSAGFIESCVPLAGWYRFGKTVAGTFTCPHCGAVYEVTYTKLAAANHDRTICVKCRKVMKEWDDAFSRSFRLKY
jgi:predicted Zn finger-like uncharacterized protein